MNTPSWRVQCQVGPQEELSSWKPLSQPCQQLLPQAHHPSCLRTGTMPSRTEMTAQNGRRPCFDEHRKGRSSSCGKLGNPAPVIGELLQGGGTSQDLVHVAAEYRCNGICLIQETKSSATSQAPSATVNQVVQSDVMWSLEGCLLPALCKSHIIPQIQELHLTALHYVTLHSIALHCITLHYTTTCMH